MNARSRRRLPWCSIKAYVVTGRRCVGSSMTVEERRRDLRELKTSINDDDGCCRREDDAGLARGWPSKYRPRHLWRKRS